MLHVNIDDRSNNTGNACSTCCCEPISMRAGETRLVTLNYAPWVIPIMANGGPGLVGTPAVTITANDDACQNEAIDGVAPPSTTGLYFTINQNVALNTPLTYDLKDDMAPATNTFEFGLHPVSGPFHGSLTATPLNGDSWIYQPANGFVGYDQFWVDITDAQGRKITRPVNLNVGGATDIPPVGWGQNAAMGLQIDRAKMKINSQLQTISFPMYLPPSNGCDTIDGCRTYRATIKALAQDCDNVYSHITCLDVRCARC